MRKLIKTLALSILAVFSLSASVYADVGDMGFFGGISEGRRLPKTTEDIISKSSQKTGRKAKGQTGTFIYKEVVFLSGKPAVFEGLIDVAANGGIQDDLDAGTYIQTFRVYPSAATTEEASIERSMTLRVNYRKEYNQVIEDYAVESWSESIQAGGASFTLDRRLSDFGASVIKDKTPGVTYYRGDISTRSVYSSGGGSPEDGSSITVVEGADSFYGYACAWSSSEAHRMDQTVSSGDWQMQVQVRPGVSVNKLLQYSRNEPSAMSFEGNYKEVIQNESGLKYDIFIAPHIYPDQKMSGGISIPGRNAFEQLTAPDMAFLKGHYAEEDIKKLFSMQILDGDPKYYQPHQAITRGQFVTALSKAVKLPVEAQKTARTSRKVDAHLIVFPDVTSQRPDYPYIMAAYRNGVAIGRDNGTFYADAPLERQEAVAAMIRSLGLANLGLDPTAMTPFTDDDEIGYWARRELDAARRLGLLLPDESGRARPVEFVSKAEAAAFLSRLVDYMRSGLSEDYSKHIVNFG
ncbi:MAG: S-layer homology domain-containing protein [Clostridiales bacterium]|jgi:hypothetical protein|nr:S-layer homology domain-containing protein [Clostridiales bacterium]